MISYAGGVMIPRWRFCDDKHAIDCIGHFACRECLKVFLRLQRYIAHTGWNLAHSALIDREAENWDFITQ
eukprot:11185597-Lingulodinium_polyedra.AAC.1